MRYPTLKEIKIIPCKKLRQQPDLLNIKEWGRCPVVVNLSEVLKLEDLEMFLEEFEDFLVLQGLNALFPYGIFIKTSLIDHHEFFPIISDSNFIKRYYLDRTRKASTLETSLLQKIDILIERLVNHRPRNDVDFINRSAEMRKMIFDTCAENDFYENILQYVVAEDEMV